MFFIKKKSIYNNMFVSFRLGKFDSENEKTFSSFTYIAYKEDPMVTLNDPSFDRRFFRFFNITKRNMNVLSKDRHETIMRKLHGLAVKMMEKHHMTDYRYNTESSLLGNIFLTFDITNCSSEFFEMLGDGSSVPIDETFF